MKPNEKILKNTIGNVRFIKLSETHKNLTLDAMKEAQIKLLYEVLEKMEEVEFSRHYTDIKEILEQFKKELK